MLYISTSKIKESTVGSSFTVTYSANPESVEQLKALHSTYSSVNMCGFTIKPSDSEKPNNCETCKHDLWHTPRMCGKCVRQEDGKPSMYEPKTEPQTVRSNLEPFRVDEPKKGEE